MSDLPEQSDDQVVEQPLETLAVTFFETPCLAVRAQDGTLYMAIGDVCSATGLRLSGQRRRLRAHPDLRVGLKRFRVRTTGGLQDVDCLTLEFIPAWLATVSRANATPAVQERLRYFTLFAIREVYAAVAREAGLPEGASRQIEDLGDLSAFDQSIQRLAERQKAIEESQEKARQAWRNLDARLRRLEEASAHGKLSVRQRGVVYHMVHAWAEARAQRERIDSGAALRACWATLRARYVVSGYEDIQADHYDDCVTYIQRHYQKLTGKDLPIPQQGELDL